MKDIELNLKIVITVDSDASKTEAKEYVQNALDSYSGSLDIRNPMFYIDNVKVTTLRTVKK